MNKPASVEGRSAIRLCGRRILRNVQRHHLAAPEKRVRNGECKCECLCPSAGPLDVSLVQLMLKVDGFEVLSSFVGPMPSSWSGRNMNHSNQFMVTATEYSLGASWV